MNETKSPQYYNARAEVLGAASDAVLKDRNASYGPPESNFQDIADVWNWWFSARKRENVAFSDPQWSKISAIDVAHMMILMKMARLKHNPMHRDSKVDVAGYAACAAECELRAVNPETIGKAVGAYNDSPNKGARNETVKDIIQDQSSKPNHLVEAIQHRNPFSPN